MGDQETQQDLSRLIEEHLPLVKHIVFQVAVHFPRHVEREELARAGALGLVEAARRYDEARGVPFERFAAQRIRGAILDAVRAADWAPRSVRVLARKLESVEQRLATRLGRVPTLDEMAEALDLSRAELTRLQDRMFRSVVLALEHEVGDVAEEDLTLVDVLTDQRTLEPCQELETRELHGYLRDAISLLPERHRLVVIGYFLEGRTSQELARFLGVTESRVSQLRSEALLMLKDGIESQYDDAPVEEAPVGRVARRKATYAQAIATASPWTDRMERVQMIESDAVERVAVRDLSGTVATLRRVTQAHRSMPWRALAGLVAVGALFTSCGGSESPNAAAVVEAGDEAELPGVTVVPVSGAHHVSGTVDYPTSPPAGGDHNGVWQNCGFYSVPVINELAVHSLEHGAVWITYRPDVDDATTAEIEALAKANPYVLASPYTDNPAPVVLTAWGRQVALDSIDDPLVAQFLDTYLQTGPTTPEPGAACSGAVGVPPDQPNTLVG